MINYFVRRTLQTIAPLSVQIELKENSIGSEKDLANKKAVHFSFKKLHCKFIIFCPKPRIDEICISVNWILIESQSLITVDNFLRLCRLLHMLMVSYFITLLLNNKNDKTYVQRAINILYPTNGRISEGGWRSAVNVLFNVLDFILSRRYSIILYHCWP